MEQKHMTATRASVIKSRRRRRRLQKLVRTLVFLFFAVDLILVVCGVIYIRSVLRSGQVESASADTQFITRVTVQDEEEITAQAPDTGIVVVLDAGHGGEDPGTISSLSDECDINLAVTQKIAAILTSEGINVVLTRDGDETVSLEERVTLANGSGADYFFSLHCNYYEDDSSISGLECYYYGDSQTSRTLAEQMTDYLSSQTDIEVRSARDGDLYVLRRTKMTAVLIELGYLSNAGECSRLISESYQETLAQAVADSIMDSILD